MHRWKRWIAAIAIGVSMFGIAACDGDPEDPDQVEEQVDELEQDVRENTP